MTKQKNVGIATPVGLAAIIFGSQNAMRSVFFEDVLADFLGIRRLTVGT